MARYVLMLLFVLNAKVGHRDFRKLYLKHKKSLHTKRVSKQNRRAGKSKGKSPSTFPPPQRADAPTPSDDAASVASQESHVNSFSCVFSS